jgi:hypothetical protein
VQQDFDREVLSRLPLAEATLSLWSWVCDEQPLRDLYDRHRGGCYEGKISFPRMTQLIRDALLEHDGSGHKSFQHARQDGQLPTALSCAYDKLGRMPLAVSPLLAAENRGLTPPARRVSEQTLSVAGMTDRVHTAGAKGPLTRASADVEAAVIEEARRIRLLFERPSTE